MSQSSQDHTSGISGRYAFALFELIQEDYDLNELDKINDELSTIGSAISQSEEMSKIIQSPIYNAQEQFSAMQSVLEILNTSELLTNFIVTQLVSSFLLIFNNKDDLPVFLYLSTLKNKNTEKNINITNCVLIRVNRLFSLAYSSFSRARTPWRTYIYISIYII